MERNWGRKAIGLVCASMCVSVYLCVCPCPNAVSWVQVCLSELGYLTSSYITGENVFPKQPLAHLRKMGPHS